MMPPVLFFRIALAIWDFCVSIQILGVFAISLKDGIGILIGVAFSLSIALGGVNIWTVLIHLSQDPYVSLNSRKAIKNFILRIIEYQCQKSSSLTILSSCLTENRRELMPGDRWFYILSHSLDKKCIRRLSRAFIVTIWNDLLRIPYELDLALSLKTLVNECSLQNLCWNKEH